MFGVPALRKEQAACQSQQYDEQFTHTTNRIRSDAKLHFFPEKSAARAEIVDKKGKTGQKPGFRGGRFQQGPMRETEPRRLENRPFRLTITLRVVTSVTGRYTPVTV